MKFTPVSDLKTATNVFRADLYHHKNCLESYLQKYERATAAPKHNRKYSKKRSLFSAESDAIDKLLKEGIGVPLSDLWDLINNEQEVVFENKEVKLFLMEHFGDSVHFRPSEQLNEYPECFYHNLTCPM